MKHTRKNKDDRPRARWTGSRCFDRSCRNAGSCNYCRSNRLAAVRRQEAAAKAELELLAHAAPGSPKGEEGAKDG